MTALYVTKAFHASLHILHVADAFPSKNIIFPNQVIQYKESARKEGQKILEKAAKIARDNGVTPEIILDELTDPSRTTAMRIIEAASATNADLLVIGTHGRSGINRFLWGSVAEEAARSSCVPTLLVRANKEEKIMVKKRYDLEDDEKKILKDFEKGEFVSVENTKEELKQAKQAANNFMKRDTRINIRISAADLNMVRRVAVQEGLPYQTLLASVIHKFVTGRLVNKENNSHSRSRE